MSLLNDDSLAIAQALCAEAGQPEAVALEQLAGGKNNRVFLVRTQAGPPVVMKRYHVDARDTRDRLAHEWAFLSYVWERGVRNIPRPLVRDARHAAALYSHVAGRRLSPAQISGALVDQAAEFIIAANAAPRHPDDLPPGSESCFSVAAHVETVDRRVARLASLDETAPWRNEAEDLIEKHLLPAWQHVRASIVSHFGAAIDDLLPPEQNCVSPSDFGFHNALVDDKDRAAFIDFEYAGRDDPAKLVCDFFCCPEIQVPIRFHQAFVQHVADGLQLDDAFITRCNRLLDAYRVKWACIILNDFLPLGAARREFANGGERAARCEAQLEKATLKLSEITMN